MLAIRVDLLTGRYVATAYNDRDRAEWPPHPARLVSALVATWAEGAPDTTEGEVELAALRWLETLSPPTILASAYVGRRTASTVFVPVNDVGVINEPNRDKLIAAERALDDATGPSERARAEKQLAALRQKLAADTAKAVAVPAKFGKHDAAAADRAMIDQRMRQPRTFPSVCPETPAFAFVWEVAEPRPGMLATLDRLVRRLVRLGHSSSLVHARLVDSDALAGLASTTRFVPDDSDGDDVIRWIGPGQIDRLIRAHERYQQVEPRVLPARFVAYRQGASQDAIDLPSSIFDDREWIVYAHRSGARLPVTSTVGLARQFRRALMSVADQPVDELISGHRPDGSPGETPHVAIVPLPFVTGPHPDGSLLGVLVAVPRMAQDSGRHALSRALAHLEVSAAGQDPAGLQAQTIRLLLGEGPPLVLSRVVWGDDPRATLRQVSWARPSRRWASATPVALDRNPGDLHDAEPQARARAYDAARASVIESITRIGLPAPLEVDVVRSCVLPGTAKPRAFPRYPIDARKPQRVLVHVRLVFAQPVRGPVLIGAGRYHGLGLCAPLDPREQP